jgi:hypothetical protein
MDAHELEARLKEIDEQSESEPIEVNIEPSGNLNVSVKRKVVADAPMGESPTPPSDNKDLVQTETLLDVNLSDVDVPDEYVDRKVRAIFSNQDTVGELAPLTVEHVGATGKFKVAADYTYNADGYSITAVKGFEYNRASVPRIFWVIISKDDLSSVAPLFHDLIYHYKGRLPENQVSPYRIFERKDADDLFLVLMRKSKVKKWRANFAYQAVSKLGGPACRG